MLYPDAREGIGVLGLYDGEREAEIGAKTKNNTNTGDLGERRLTKELSGNNWGPAAVEAFHQRSWGKISEEMLAKIQAMSLEEAKSWIEEHLREEKLPFELVVV